MDLQGNTQGLTCLSFSPDGTCIAGNGFDRAVRVWNSVTGQLLMTGKGTTEYTSLCNSMAFSPDGMQILSADWSGNLLLWELGRDKRD
jgi:WD40 repeat protein